MSKKLKQLSLFSEKNRPHGGELLKTRAGRAQLRPLSTKNSMHLVLRSTKAIGDWSFTKTKNRSAIKSIVSRTAKLYSVKFYSVGIVGNHIHFHIKLGKRSLYAGFIKSLTAGIAMVVTGANRMNPIFKDKTKKFWDYRPFTRIVVGFQAFLKLKDYVEINQLEGFGLRRREAEFYIAWNDTKFDMGNTA